METRVDSTRRPGFRGDIEGLRAVAVLLVLFFHAGVAPVAGGFAGVDVFFVISGFLITRLITSELARTGRVSLLGFYARRARRLLPGAAVVLVAVLLLTVLLLPRTRWADTGWDVLTSGLYVVNWRLADRAVDYLAADTAPSMVQHFWSLAVEEQFYLVWPLLLLFAVRLAHRLAAGRVRDVERPLLVALVVVALPSFAWSVHLVGAEPERAYFITTTRMWELAIGCGIAILAGRLAQMPRLVAAATGWVGIGMVIASAFVLDESTSIPGLAALVPTVGAAAVLAGGAAAGGIGPAAVLDTRPLRAVGALSYSLYLWHWPLLVVAESRFGELSTGWSLAVVASSAVPAWLTYRYVENPLRLSAVFAHFPARALRLGALCTAIPVVCAVALHLSVTWSARTSPSTAANQNGATGHTAAGLGAGVLSEHPRDDPRGAPVDRVASMTPDPVAVRDDYPDVYDDGCHQRERDADAAFCVYGEAHSSFTVALVGDSHAAQWVPALQSVAATRRWRLVTYTKSSCPLAQAQVLSRTNGRAYPSCAEWNGKVLRALTGVGRPDLVVTTNADYRIAHGAVRLSAPDGDRAMVEGLRASWRAITAAGVPVVVLRDTPAPGANMPDCISAHPTRLSRCAFDRAAAQAAAGSVQEAAAAGMLGVHLLDLNDAICPTHRCAPVIGEVIVYRDSNHLTATYARSLAPRLDTALRAILQ
ncbi:acyltransferase [Catellatospora sp. IY07-71]|uniref:acyltransferase family protein n=1 Tax=Catellatospora sp. IY07-71 TaxID=2728827 RepID=UPI001BB2F8D9|nr:acyltransferase family protein [Catellatospora sp. IY07-71]BCJ75970.1 acyltransferase [Catellatospora sp. IY07-71]